MVTSTCNSGTRKAEAGGYQIWHLSGLQGDFKSHPRQLRKSLSQNTKEDAAQLRAHDNWVKSIKFWILEWLGWFFFSSDTLCKNTNLSLRIYRLPFNHRQPFNFLIYTSHGVQKTKIVYSALGTHNQSVFRGWIKQSQSQKNPRLCAEQEWESVVLLWGQRP